MVGEFFVHPNPPKAKVFTVGSAQGVDFAMGEGKLGAPKFDILKADGHGFTLRFTGKMKGELHRRDEVTELKAIIESGKASHDGDSYALTLENDDFAWIDLGGITLEVSFQPVPKPVLVPLLDSIDYTMLNIFLVMFFLGAMFVVTALNLSGEGDEFEDELSGNQARIAKLIIKPPEAMKNPLLEKLAAQKAKAAGNGEVAARHKGDEGKAGKKDAPKTQAHATQQQVPDHKAQARSMMKGLFGGKNGIGSVFDNGGIAGLKNAMGGLVGARAGDAFGMGGVGLRGSGSGGGGTGESFGIGSVGTKGRGGGSGGYGMGVGGLGGKQGVDIGITSSDPVVMGSLDKELIRQVIHRNRNQIRFCYESLLQRYPKLGGKVAVKFVISGNGNVIQSNVAQSTSNSPELDTCVAGRVHTWNFPKPKGGGIVVVTYPFIFKQSGE
jgi:TonB family protein